MKDFALKMHSIFVSTYACENTFSTMKQVKPKHRNQVTDETLDDSVGRATIRTGIDEAEGTKER